MGCGRATTGRPTEEKRGGDPLSDAPLFNTGKRTQEQIFWPPYTGVQGRPEIVDSTPLFAFGCAISLRQNAPYMLFSS